MRVMIDTPVYRSLWTDKSFRTAVERACSDWVTVVFSVGNFLDFTAGNDTPSTAMSDRPDWEAVGPRGGSGDTDPMEGSDSKLPGDRGVPSKATASVEGDEAIGRLARVIDGVTDEYLAPLQLDLAGEYRYSSSPLILSTVDAEWYEQCKRATRGMEAPEILEFLFRNSAFEDGPVTAKLSTFVEEYRELDADNAPQSVAVKKVRTFPNYTTRDTGTVSVEDERVPTKRYVVGMAMIYISETCDEPTLGDYRDGMIWAQAIISGCDVFWTDHSWPPDHSILRQVYDRLDREPITFVETREAFTAVTADME